MKIRFTAIDEYNMLVSLKHKTWGSKTNRFRIWEEGDLIVLRVKQQVACVLKITGPSYKSEVPLWSNGVFQWRIPVELHTYFAPDQREGISYFAEESLLDSFGSKYGLALQNYKPLPFIHAMRFYSKLNQIDNQNKLVETPKSVDRLLASLALQMQSPALNSNQKTDAS